MRVRISQTAKSATQSGRGKVGLWLITPVKSTGRTPDPLMGWPSADEPTTALRDRLMFYALADAIAFAKKRGWQMDLQKPQRRRVTPKSYTDNFDPRRPVGDGLV